MFEPLINRHPHPAKAVYERKDPPTSPIKPLINRHPHPRTTYYDQLPPAPVYCYVPFASPAFYGAIGYDQLPLAPPCIVTATLIGARASRTGIRCYCQLPCVVTATRLTLT
jgi:hypothetical protein